MVSTLEAKQTSRAAFSLLRSHVGFQLGSSASVTDEELIELLVQSGLDNEFVNTTAKRRQLDQPTVTEIDPERPAPLAKALLYHLRTIELDAVDQQFDRVQQELFEQAAVARLFTTKVDVAIDIHDWLFYGDEDTDYVLTTKRSKGTNLAFRFATICVVVHGLRFCLDWRVLPANDWRSKRQVVRSLLETVRDQVTISQVFLDRGFYQAGVIDILNALDVTYLVRAPSHAGPDDRIEDDAVVDPTYEVRQRYSPYLTAPTTFVAVPADDDEDDVFRFVTNAEVSAETASAYALAFRRRWGIETSYRKLTEFLPKTSSPTFSVRLFYFSVASTLYNLWVLANLFIHPSAPFPERPPLPTAIFRKVIEIDVFDYG
ncbi:transposase [Natronorubrum aibiense]|uniref:transposase n=1 Tax=Natronorubrum aibiense TaxID=348826 RepID=UPI001D058331|nr:transposase [Natronorubrum aibiense]